MEGRMGSPFFLSICIFVYRYTPRMIRLETMYRARTPIRTLGSSKGIFFDTCIITRMITKLVLWHG